MATVNINFLRPYHSLRFFILAALIANWWLFLDITVATRYITVTAASYEKMKNIASFR